MRSYRCSMKRLFDLFLSIFLLIFLSPLLIVVSFTILITLGRPILFIQERPGENGKVFRLIKFRTMLETRDEAGELLSDEQRITSFGSILRSTSIDELPELFNILKGEMSFVGPRPLLIEYMKLYSEEQNRRHDVRPGITGWAQVNGRNALDWQERFDLDLWYVENRSLFLDLRILLLTVKKVIIREGITAEAEATMKKFTGNRE